MLHKNLIAINMGMGNPVQRPDGFWESNMAYGIGDPSRSVRWTALQPAACQQIPGQTISWSSLSVAQPLPGGQSTGDAHSIMDMTSAVWLPCSAARASSQAKTGCSHTRPGG
jgi:hypothetical protein